MYNPLVADASYVELFNDHPGSFQDIPTNDAVTKQIVDSIMNNASYKDNTVIVITEDDTSTVISPRFDARIDGFGYIELNRRRVDP